MDKKKTTEKDFVTLHDLDRLLISIGAKASKARATFFEEMQKFLSQTEEDLIKIPKTEFGALFMGIKKLKEQSIKSANYAPYMPEGVIEQTALNFLRSFIPYSTNQYELNPSAIQDWDKVCMDAATQKALQKLKNKK